VSLALVALLACAAPAFATEVTTRGSVVVRWQSNPATCAEHGLCGRSGSLSWRPERNVGGFSQIGADFGYLSLYDAEAIARSHRGAESCIDRVDAPADIVGKPGTRRGVLTVTMREIKEFGFGRCAGPLGSDFAAALPQSPPLTANALRNGTLIDLRGRTPFSAGPFEGEVISTLTFRTRRERPSSDGGESTQTTTAPRQPEGHVVHYGTTTATYAIEQLTGDAGYAFSGAPRPECRPFDACEMTGDVTLHADVHEGSLTLSSTRRLAPGARETVAAGLRALRRGGTRFFGDVNLGPEFDPDREPEPESPFAIPFSASATPAGGETCTDTGSFTELYLAVGRRRAGIALRLLHGGNSRPDPLRTRCPGPGSDDVGALASGLLPLDSVAEPRVELTLKPAGFTTLGMRGAGRGDLKLSLRLTTLRATTRDIRVQREDFP
jgi:hypothetical protein